MTGEVRAGTAVLALVVVAVILWLALGPGPERHDGLRRLGPHLVLSKPVRFGQLVEACGGGEVPPAPLTCLDRSVAGLFDRGGLPEPTRFPGISA